MAPASGVVESWEMPLEPGCMAPARSGGLVIALRDGIYRARAWGGALVLITLVCLLYGTAKLIARYSGVKK